MKLTKCLAVAVLCLAISGLSNAQDDSILGMGFTPFGSYHGGDVDSVNLSNGFLNLHIPLVSVPQRGAIRYEPQVIYRPAQWSIQSHCDTENSCTAFWIYRAEGLRLLFYSPDNFGAGNLLFAKGSTITILKAATADGGSHEMGRTSNGAETLDGTQIWYDGTAFPNTGMSRNGNGLVNNGHFEDSNGNFFNVPPSDGSLMPDTMGRAVLGSANGTATSDFSGCTGPLPATGAATYSFPGYGGATEIIKTCTASMTVQSNFQITGFFNDLEIPITDRSYSSPIIQSIVIYNGTSWTSSPSWTFEYGDRDPGDAPSVNYGSLTKITLPTGASISYTWAGTMTNCGGQADNPTPSRFVTSRTVDANDGTAAQQWTYNGGSVTDPQGNVTVHTFGLVGSGCSGYETETDYYQGSKDPSHLLKTVTTTYRSINDPWNTITKVIGATNVFPTVVTTTWPSGKSSRIETDYDNNLSFFVNGGAGPFTGSYGEVTETREYDYDGSLIRRTDYTYKAFDGSSNSASYFAANLLRKVSSITTYDGGGHQVAQIKYGYDELPLQASGVTTQLDSTSANAGIRGNRTSENHWLNTTGGMLTTTTSYYDTGTPYQITDPGGHTTTNIYGAGFQSGADFVGAFVTQTKNALQQSGYADYDFNTGLTAASKDANGVVTSLTYDIFKRIKSKTAPDNTSLWNYTDSQPPFFTASSGPNLAAQPYTVEGDLDTLGRRVQSKITSDPSGTDTTDMTYDPLGRVATVSNPHRSTSSPTDGATSTTYDALGRVTQVTAQDGSLTTTDYTQFPTVTVSDPVGNQRQSRTDALGRLVEVDEPASHFVPDQPPTQASPGTGTIVISGTEQSQQVQTVAAVPGTATITFSGARKTGKVPDCPLHQQCPTFDSGSVTITVGGVPAGVSYGQNLNTTSAAIASQLISSINTKPGMPVTASASGTTGVVISSSNGTNYTFSLSDQYDTEDFTSPSFSWTTTPSNGVMSGGQPAQFASSPDTGSVSVVVNGTPYTVSTGQSSTASNIASALATMMNGAILNATSSVCVPVTSTCGATITISSVATGAASNYALSSSASSTLHSFSAVASGGSLTGGGNATADVPAHTTWSGWAATLYKYDALGNLYCVEQHGNASTGTGCPTTPPGPSDPPVQPDPNNAWRRRLFAYDSLSRLRWASNPESGVITYSYDVDGNLLQKTSPDPNAPAGSPATQVISYCYDALHRVTGKAYSQQACVNGLLPSGTAAVSYHYDQTAYNGLTIANGIGRRTGMDDQAGTEAWSYDQMGMPLFDSRTIAGITKTTGYLYDYMGNVSKLTYPSGTAVNYTYNTANQAISAVDSTNSINYATAGLYSPPGALTSVTNGINVTSAFYYNSRLQPCRISVSAGSANPSSCTDATIGNIMDLTYGFGTSGTNNGNLASIANNRDTARSQSFTYDPLNRISTAQTTYSTTGSHCWGETYGYDGWGNLLTLAGITPQYSGCTQESGFGVSANAANQLSNQAYDAAGNMMLTGYAYDPENRILVAGAVTYTYDGDGKRVEKSTGKIYWYGMGSTVLDETDLTGSTTNSAFNEYAFLNGKRTARRDSSNKVFYYFADHLGTSHVIVQSGQTTPCYEADFYPFGGEQSPYVDTCDQNYKFTGKERDGETGLDYFGARYYSNGLGRFMSVDPQRIAIRHLLNPQKLNKYSYVLNNPISSVDPDGMEEIKVFVHFTSQETLPKNQPNWSAIQQTAQANGNHVTVFQGDDVNEKNFQSSLASGGTTVFIGHSQSVIQVQGGPEQTVAISLADKEIGQPSNDPMVAGAGRMGTDPDVIGSLTNPGVLPDVSSSSNVALFGCATDQLASQYSSAASFVGVDSSTNHVTTTDGLLSAGGAYVADLAANKSISSAVDDANKNINKDPIIDKNDKVEQIDPK
jgi:RHS repeat-associated protein